MGYGFYDPERRYQRRKRRGFFKFLFIVAALVVLALFSYQMGVEQVKGRDASLREDKEQLSRRKAELELLVGQLRGAARTAEARSAELEQRLAREVPQGDLAKLGKMVAERLAAGVTMDRLSFLITSAQNLHRCQPMDTKRLQPATPVQKSADRAISYGNNSLIVLGEAQALKDSSGAYDPNQPVTLHIIPQGMKEVTAVGLLPLRASVVVENTEFQFTAFSSGRTFIEVRAERCAYP